MIKKISYFALSLVGIVSTFLAYGTISLEFSEMVPEAMHPAIIEGASKDGALFITFFEKIGDFNNTSLVSFQSVVSAICILIALIAVFTIFTASVMAMFKSDDAALEAVNVKVLSFIALGAFVVSLIFTLMSKAPTTPEALTAVGVTGLASSIGLGSILFLVTTALLAAIAPVSKAINK